MTNVKTYNHDLWDHGITQGYSVNGIIYISGQFSHDKEGIFVGEGDIESQTRQTLKNLDRVLEGFVQPRLRRYLSNKSARAFRVSHRSVQGIPRKTPTCGQPHRRNLLGVLRATD